MALDTFIKLNVNGNLFHADPEVFAMRSRFSVGDAAPRVYVSAG